MFSHEGPFLRHTEVFFWPELVWCFGDWLCAAVGGAGGEGGGSVTGNLAVYCNYGVKIYCRNPNGEPSHPVHAALLTVLHLGWWKLCCRCPSIVSHFFSSPSGISTDINISLPSSRANQWLLIAVIRHKYRPIRAKLYWLKLKAML